MNDLGRVYDALAREADSVVLASAGDLRVRADRRTRVRVVAVCAAVVIAAGGATGGAQWALRAGGDPAPLPGHTEPAPPSPSAARPPTPAPSPTLADITDIPDRALLQRADLPGDWPIADDPVSVILPSLCGAQYASDSAITARRIRNIPYWLEQRPEGFTPDGAFVQTITGYRSDGGAQFMSQLRTAVEDCPSQIIDGWTTSYQLLPAVRHGDDSVLLEVRSPAHDVEDNPTGGDEVRLVSVVRIDRVVMVLYETGWEVGSAQPAVVESTTEIAVSRLHDWLG